MGVVVVVVGGWVLCLSFVRLESHVVVGGWVGGCCVCRSLLESHS